MSFLIDKLFVERDYSLTFLGLPKNCIRVACKLSTEQHQNNSQVLSHKNDEKAVFENYVRDITFNKETVMNSSRFLHKMLRIRG